MYASSNGGILSFLKSIDIPAFLDGTSKTLNVINQAIPVFYQVKPILGNIGTIFKISSALNESGDSNMKNTSTINNSINTSNQVKNSPIFFV